MAVIRLSPGVYQDSKTGRRVNAITQAEAVKKLAPKKNTQAARPTVPITPEVQQPTIPPPPSTPDTPITGGTPNPTPTPTPEEIIGGSDIPKEEKEKIGNEIPVIKADANIKSDYLNPDYVNSLGSQVTTRDANGNIVVTNTLSGDQQGILDRGEGLTKMGQELAKEQLGGYTPFSMGTDSTADRARIEDEVFGRLTRNTDRDYAKEKEQLEQTLYNRGIPLDPSDPQYKSNMDALNERYDTQKSNARAYATELGGQELSRSYGMGLSTHQQGMADTTALQQQGTGLMMPNQVGYNAPDVQSLSNPNEIDIAFQQLRQQGKLNAAQIAAQNRQNRGGGSTDSAFATS